MHVNGLYPECEMRINLKCLTVVSTYWLTLAAPVYSDALAQNANSAGAGSMWGTNSSGVSVAGAVDSANNHNLNSMVAGSANAARSNLLITNGPNYSISSVGSQSIVSTTIVGNNNGSSTSAGQSTSNTGATTAHGTMVNSPGSQK